MFGHLIARLDESGKVFAIKDGNENYTFASGDRSRYALVLLTGQRPADYKLVVSGYNISNRQVGFTSKADRAAALAKFKDWWKSNRDKPPYKDLQPLAVPVLPRPSADDPVGTPDSVDFPIR